MQEALNCPLCDDEFQYRKIERDGNATHTWHCNNCSALLIEYYDESDIKALLEAKEKEVSSKSKKIQWRRRYSGEH